MKPFGDGKKKLTNIALFIPSMVLGVYFMLDKARLVNALGCFIVALSCVIRPMIEAQLKKSSSKKKVKL